MCFLLQWGEGQEGCRGLVLVYNHLRVAIAAEGSGDMLPFCILVCDRDADFVCAGEQTSDHCSLVGEGVV